MGEILSRCGEIGWKVFGEKCCECLLGGLEKTQEQRELNSRLAATVEALSDFQGGDEHRIFLPPAEANDHVLKWTYGDNYGLQLKVYEIDPDGMNHHVISTGNPDPRYYLNRWIIPFDAVAEHPSNPARKWCAEKAASLA